MKNSTLESLLEKHHKDAFLWALQCCRYSKDDANDVLQMAYLKIVEGKAKFKEQSLFKTWLFSVIRFTAIDFMKTNHSYQTLDGLELTAEPALNSEETNYNSFLLKLTDRNREVLLLAFYHQMTLAVIAETTGLHIGTVRTHYERGKSALRKLIETVAI
jgi:RNA polymerase sigma-70 factor (ECF subfamily)